MLVPSFIATAALVGLAQAQGVGTEEEETHPSMTWSECTGTGGESCTEVEGQVVVDANWRWLHGSNDTTNCYTGNEWDADLCPDNPTCSENCVVDGADYEGTYGITASGDELTLVYVTEGPESTNVGSRVYMMEDESNYKMFELLGNEFTFDVDLSGLVCGLNGALYFVKMDAEGQGEAGAQYGTGYCDSQCPRDLKFIDGVANVEGWEPSEGDKNAGVGGRGACCSEMDIWEANSISNALTPHACDTVSFTECEGEECGGTYSDERYAGTCDPDGCDFNPYRVGVTDFYGEGMDVDTSSVMTVVTQFLTDDSGSLSEIKRFYVQGDTVIEQPDSAIEGVEGNSITTDYCDAENSAFGEDVYPFKDHGGMASMSEAMEGGMVLVMSLWGDFYANMEWLDSNYPTDRDASEPGVARGSCENGVGDPTEIVDSNPDASVTFSNIKFGPIGSTFDEGTAKRRIKAKKPRRNAPGFKA